MSRKTNLTLPDLRKLNLEVKLTGDWTKLDRLAANLSPSIQKGYDQSILIYSQKLLRIVKHSMLSGTPPKGGGITWKDHSEATTDRYGKHPIYNLTGLYSRSIGLFKYKSRTLIGVPIGRKLKTSQDGGITLNQLAKILEFGSDRIPARPLWSPAYKAIGGNAELRRLIIKNIRSQLSSSTGITTKQVRWG